MATYSVSKAAPVHLTRVLDLLAHTVSPEAVADTIVYLVSDAATPVSSTVVPAYGA